MGSYSRVARHCVDSRLARRLKKGDVHRRAWTDAPLLVQWMATLRCELACPHCLAAGSGCSDMALKDVCRLIDQVAEIGVEEFLLTGGEPLIREDLAEVIQYLAARKVSWSLNTAVLPRPALQRLIRKNPPGFVAVSLDGPQAVHDGFRGRDGAYEEALASLRFFSELSGCHVAAGTTVTSRNFQTLAATFSLVPETGADEWGIHLPMPEGRAADRPDLFLSRRQLRELMDLVVRYRKYFPVQMADEFGYCGDYEPLLRDEPLSCGAGRTHCVVLPDGEVVPCTTLDHSASAGNVLQKPLQQIWQEGFREIRNWQPEGRCTTCIYARACEGGCWLQARKGTPCYRDVWELPAALRTAASVALCLGLASGAGAAAEPEQIADVVVEDGITSEVDFEETTPPALPGIGGGLPQANEISTALDAWILSWSTRELAPYYERGRGSKNPSSVPPALQNDPAGIYLEKLCTGNLPADTAGICRQVQACLKSRHFNLSLSALLWRNLSERILDGKHPGGRTEEEVDLLRQTLALLKARMHECRKKSLAAKLGTYRDMGSYPGGFGRFGSKAGPRPRPYDSGLQQDLQRERWSGLAALREQVADQYLARHPVDENYRIRIALPAGTTWSGPDRTGPADSSTRDIGIFDSFCLSADDSEPVAMEVSWGSASDSRSGRCRAQVQVDPGVWYTYIDLLRCAKGSVPDWQESKARGAPASAQRRRRRPLHGYFSIWPANPLLLQDVRGALNIQDAEDLERTEKRRQLLVWLTDFWMF